MEIYLREKKKGYGSDRKHRRNRGMMSVEASLIIPLILIAVMFAVSLSLFAIKESVERARLVETVYTEIPEDSLFNKKVVRDTDVRMEVLGMFGSGSKYFAIHLHAEREGELCTERLRRWQLYGDIRGD